MKNLFRQKLRIWKKYFLKMFLSSFRIVTNFRILAAFRVSVDSNCGASALIGPSSTALGSGLNAVTITSHGIDDIRSFTVHFNFSSSNAIKKHPLFLCYWDRNYGLNCAYEKPWFHIIFSDFNRIKDNFHFDIVQDDTRPQIE